jgi:aerobic carbon-monoxide dehydrogenase large subunit
MTGPDKASFVGRSIPRREDRRLLTGQGRFIADIELPRMLHAAFVRSPVAHARICSVDLSQAAGAPGVVHVFSGADVVSLAARPAEGPIHFPESWKKRVRHRFDNPVQTLLATDKVRYVGEPVAVILAAGRYQAEDAAERVAMDLEPLRAVVDVDEARKGGAVLLHEQFKSNVTGEFEIGKGDVKAALARAPHRIRRRFHHHRYSGMPMEGKGVVAAPDSRTSELCVFSTTQTVHSLRREIAQLLQLPEASIRCVAPDVGGSFGVKNHATEYLLIPLLAQKLRRAISWIEDRREHMLSAVHSRDQFHDLEAGFDDSGRILALRDHFVVDSGAWPYTAGTVPYNTAAHLLGPYKIDNVAIKCEVVSTTKTPAAPYRGAGRPEAVFPMERMIDLIAAELKLEPAEVRLRNMVRADEMPYRVGLLYRDGNPIVYDSGDYPEGLRKVLSSIGGIEAFRRRQQQARELGRYLGLGLAAYTEGTGIGPFEGAVVRIDASGKIVVSAGACPQGQGMETIYAQVVADLWSVDIDDVIVTLADSSSIPLGFGTIASRSAITVSSAIHFASKRLQRKVFAVAAEALECAPTDLELRRGGVGIVGVPGREVTLARIALAARPGLDVGRPPGVEGGLEETYYFQPPTVTWAYAINLAIVEVDAETGEVKVERLVVAHDCGVEINPMLVEGQVVGGLVQGIGGALLEEFTYDSEGQLLTGSFMDYLLPIATNLPDIDLIHLHATSPLNPLGIKGVGEGGPIAPPAAIANAVTDALSPFGIEINSTPVRPDWLLMKIQAAQSPAAAAGPAQPRA